MKLCIEIPDDVAGSGWPEELINEGLDMCWHSDDVEGLEDAAGVMTAIAGILEHEIPEAEQQAYLDARIACPEDCESRAPFLEAYDCPACPRKWNKELP